MFRPVRRKKNEISIEEAKKLLSEARRGVLAVNGDEGYPYALPVNYYYDEEEGRIFFHSARAGHKVDALEKSDKVCFTVLGQETVKAEPWAPFVRSAVVFGRCHPVTDPSEAEARLRQFAGKYYPDAELIDEVIAGFGKAALIYAIEIEHISGKEVQER